MNEREWEGEDIESDQGKEGGGLAEGEKGW